MKQYIYLLLLSLLFISAACNPNDVETNQKTTPYTLEFPLTLGEPRFATENNPLTEEGVDLGRHLFYDKSLSRDNTISCASCHRQESAFSDNNRLSLGINGQLSARNSMSLSNLAYQKDFFWDGRSKTLEEQSLHPIRDGREMGYTIPELIERLRNNVFYVDKFNHAFPGEQIDSINLGKAIAQFEMTLLSGESKFDLYKTGRATATEQELRGERLFFTHPEPQIGRGANCGDCHSGFLTYSTSFSNNGLEENPIDKGLENITGIPEDRGKFKIPSLRNIALTAPYMHDGRFNTLEEVLDHYNEHIKSSPTLDIQISEATNNVGGTSLGLTEQEKQDVIVFLKALTDNNFTTNPAHSNPFTQN